MFGRTFIPREFVQKTDPMEGYAIRSYHTSRLSSNRVRSIPQEVVLHTGSLLTGNHLADILFDLLSHRIWCSEMPEGLLNRGRGKIHSSRPMTCALESRHKALEWWLVEVVGGSDPPRTGRTQLTSRKLLRQCFLEMQGDTTRFHPICPNSN